MEDGKVRANPKIARMAAQKTGQASDNVTGLCFDLITDPQELKQFEAGWRDLETRDTSRFTYFQTYDWCVRWFETFGNPDPLSDGPHLRVFTAHRDGKTVLVWPMMMERRSMGLNTLITLSDPHGQLSNVLVDQDIDTDAAIQDCWRHIRRLPSVDMVDVPNIPATSTLGKALLSEEQIATAEDACAIMDITKFENWADYQASLSGNARRSRKRKRKKLAGDSTLEFTVHHAGSDGYKRLVANALHHKKAWLGELGKSSRALLMSGTEKFMQGLEDAPDGSTRCLAGELAVDGHTLASEFGFERNGHYIGYLGAFDWNYRDQSPGKLEMEDMFHWCMDDAIEWYDLLGNASSYKDDWSNMSVPLVSLHEGQTVLGKAHANIWTKRLRPALKSAIESLPYDQRKFIMSTLGVTVPAGASKG